MQPASEIYDEIINDVIEGVREYFMEEIGDTQALEDLKSLWHSKLFRGEEHERPGSDLNQFLSGTRNVEISISFRRSDVQGEDANECRNFSVKVPASFQHDKDIMNRLPADVIKKIVVFPLPLANKVLQEFVDDMTSQPNVPQTDGCSFPVDSETSHLSSSSTEDVSRAKVENSIAEFLHIPQERAGEASVPFNLSISSGDNQGACDFQRAQGNTEQFLCGITTQLVNFSKPSALEVNQKDSDETSPLSSKVTKIAVLKPGKCAPAEEEMLQLDGADSESGSDTSSCCSSTTASAVDDEGAGSEELNSDDDMSEEDSESTETDNVMVCQYEKVIRRSNKWRMVLKSGVLKLDGEDYVFGKAFGAAEW